MPQDRLPTATIAVRLTPRAGRDAIRGWEGGSLRVRVAAPPLAGRANAALITLLARALGVPSRDIAIVRGTRGRDKLVEVRGLREADVRDRLG